MDKINLRQFDINKTFDVLNSCSFCGNITKIFMITICIFLATIVLYLFIFYLSFFWKVEDNTEKIITFLTHFQPQLIYIPK